MCNITISFDSVLEQLEAGSINQYMKFKVSFDLKMNLDGAIHEQYDFGQNI